MASTATFTQTYAANGTYTWVAPAGVTAVSVECVGAGGGGNGQGSGGCGGGGGGEYAAELTNTCTPGNSYTVVVGAAGVMSGANGGNSSFTGTGATTVTAHGGTSGTTSASGSAGGTGSANTVHHNGGAGGTSSSTGGSGGGGSGGSAAAGNAGTNSSSGSGGAGATAVTGGGPGGAGGAGGSAGNAPVSGPGGGGGGGTAVGNGGNGFDGQVLITWTQSSPATFTSAGTYTWTAPTGTTSVSSECWGGGGGGNQNGALGGGGGGGGEYAAELANTCTPGNVYTFVVGTAGAGATTVAVGSNGGNSTFSGTGATTVTAHGGTGGATNTAAGEAGGTGSTNSTHHDGGAGGTESGSGTGGGGGGGSGGTAATGNTGTANSGSGSVAGATAVTGGGPGGASGAANSIGSGPVSGPGGGGGGAGSSSNAGAGFAGQVRLTWTAASGNIVPQRGGKLRRKYDYRTQTQWVPVTPITSTGSPALGPLAMQGTSAESLLYGGRPQPGGKQWKRKFRRREVPWLAPPANSGSVALGPLAMQATGSVTENIFPFQPLLAKLELLVNGTWIDITHYVYQRDNVIITRGRQDETQSAQASQMTLTLNNIGGTFTPKCPNSIFYPYIKRNIQMRLSVTAISAASNFYSGYRFWGEVSAWPPQWDPTGTDVYASITVSGVFRRMAQGAPIGSPMTRYFNGLSSPYQPIAWWPCTDATGATQLASGLAGGTAATFTGTPSLASDSQFGGSDPVLELNGAVISGTTSSYGASGDDLFITPGTYTWVCPAGVTTAQVNCIGAGGGGGTGTTSQGGGGGGGGEFAEEPSYTTTPGTSYPVVVGQGGAPAGVNGGNSTFNGTDVVANGGVSAVGVTGANGGSGSTNTTHFSGGAGASTSAASGGSQSNFSSTFGSNGTFSAPTGVVSPINIQCWGGGGGGAGGGGGGGGGGAGGNYTSGNADVTAGNNYNYVVGAGGGGSGAGGNGGNGGVTQFNGDTLVVSAHGGNGGISSGGAGGAPSSASDTYKGGHGGSQVSAGKGGGGGGGGAGPSGTGGNGHNDSGNTGGAGGTGSGGGNGGKGGNNGNQPGSNGTGGSVAGGGGGGGATPLGTGGGGQRGQITINYSTLSGGSAGTSGGGGGGSSAGTGSAGNTGSVTAGGVAVTGGGPGGAGGNSSAGSTPLIGPGGGGGGGDGSASGTFAGAAGFAGQVEIIYTPPTVPNYNIIRFLLQTPSGGGTDGTIVMESISGGAVHKLDVVYNTASGGELTLKGYNAGGGNLFTSTAITGIDNTPLYVSAELANSGSSLNWALNIIKPGGTSLFGTQSGTLASSACGNVSLITMNQGGTETKATAVGQITLQYAYVALLSLGAVAGGFTGELAGDRFIRLCAEQAVPAQLIPEGYWSFEDGTTSSWVGANAAISNYTGWASVGSNSLLVTASGGGNPQASSNFLQVPVTNASEVVSAYADVKAISALAAAAVNIDFYDASDNYLSSATGTSTAMAAGQVLTLSLLAQTAPGSTAFARITVIDNDILGAGNSFAIDNAMVVVGSQMGPQQDDTMMNVLQSIEDFDCGQLYETRNSFGAAYRTRKSLVNQMAKLTLDYSKAQIAQSLQPTYDDQLTRNSIQVTRSGGSNVTVSDTTDSMSILDPPAGVGLYSFNRTVVAFADSQLTNLANWLLTLGTVDQERYPQIPVDLSRSEAAGLLTTTAGLDIGDFLRIINPPVFLPATEIDQLCFGFTETINAFIWTVSVNAVPESPYASGSLADW